VDISDKIRELKEQVGNASAEEKLVRSRISELKQLVEDKKKRDESLALAKQEEQELLSKLLG